MLCTFKHAMNMQQLFIIHRFFENIVLRGRYRCVLLSPSQNYSAILVRNIIMRFQLHLSIVNVKNTRNIDNCVEARDGKLNACCHERYIFQHLYRTEFSM